MQRHLIKRKKRDLWYAIHRVIVFDADGNRKYIEKWHPLFPPDGKRLQASSSVRAIENAMRTLEIELQLRRQTSGEREEVQTVDLAQRFLAAKQHGVRAKTLQSYKLWLERFTERFGAIPASYLETQHIERFKTDLLANGLKASTVNVALRSLRAFLNWAVKQRILVANPAGLVELVRMQQRSILPHISWKQFETLFLPKTTDVRQRAAFGLAIYAGLRREELCHLQWTHIDFQDDVINVVSTDDFQTKSGRGRQVPLFPPLKRLLTELKRSSKYVLGRSKAPPDGSAISHRWLGVFRGVNATLPESDRYPHIRLHDLRASFCTELLQRLQPAVVQQIMGHADIQTTMRHYARLSPSIAVNAAKKISFESEEAG